MHFPVDLVTLSHRFGGRITRIHRIEIVTAKPKDGRSRDAWHYIGDIIDDSGRKAVAVRISPNEVCCDDPSTNAELKRLSDALMRHLAKHGTFYAGPPHRGWYADDRSTECRS